LRFGVIFLNFEKTISVSIRLLFCNLFTEFLKKILF
jgi:hypothetical protein